MGAPEPCEELNRAESAAMLDLGLPCCDRGRMDRRLNHEPLEDIESLGPVHVD